MDRRARLERVIVESDAAIAQLDGVDDPDARAVVLDALVVKGEALIDLGRYLDAVRSFWKFMERFDDLPEPSELDSLVRRGLDCGVAACELLLKRRRSKNPLDWRKVVVPTVSLRRRLVAAAGMDDAENLARLDEVVAARGGIVGDIAHACQVEALFEAAAAARRIGQADDALARLERAHTLAQGVAEPVRTSMTLVVGRRHCAYLYELERWDETVTLSERLVRRYGTAQVDEESAAALAWIYWHRYRGLRARSEVPRGRDPVVIEAVDQMLARFATADSILAHAALAMPLSEKVMALLLSGRDADALKLSDLPLAMLGEAADAETLGAIADQVLAVDAALSELGDDDFRDATALQDAALRETGWVSDPTDLPISKPSIRARTEQSLKLLLALRERLEDRPELPLRQMLADTLVCLMGAFGRLGHVEDCEATLGQLIAMGTDALVPLEQRTMRLEQHAGVPRSSSVATFMYLRAVILAEADRYQEALDLVEQLISRFGAAESEMMQLQVDEARERRQALRTELDIEAQEG